LINDKWHFYGVQEFIYLHLLIMEKSQSRLTGTFQDEMGAQAATLAETKRRRKE
jgi:hypothetical protein